MSLDVQLQSSSDACKIGFYGRMEEEWRNATHENHGSPIGTKRVAIFRKIYPLAVGVLLLVNVVLIVLIVVELSKHAQMKPSSGPALHEPGKVVGIAPSNNFSEEYIENILNSATTKQLQALLKQTYKVNGWASLGNYIFKVFTDRVDYKTARHRCSASGGRLAAEVLRHPEATRYIINGNYIGSWNDGMMPWVGLDDLKQEGQWKWVDGGEMNPNTTRWGPGEPNSRHTTEDCGGIYKYNEDIILLHDGGCSDKVHYICEIRLD